LDEEGLSAEVRDLMTPVIGSAETEAIFKRVNALEELGNVRELRPLLTLSGQTNRRMEGRIPTL
jgi:hypothetical protein